METKQTLTLINEVQTDGHSPLKFLCDDYEIYYCKYRSGRSLNSQEVDCLFYEIVCNKLLNHLNIPTPQIALITIVIDSFAKEKVFYNKKYCKAGAIYLGSKEVSDSDILQSLSVIGNKNDFKKLSSPYDFFKIAMFDLWVNNADRGRNENYNILLKGTVDGLKYYAFDHAFCFGGLDLLRVFNPTQEISTQDRLITSRYFKSILPYLDKQTCINIVDNFLSLQANEINQCISDAFHACPLAWQIPAQIIERTSLYLLDQNRVNQIKNIMLSALT